tara:strand:- start:158 stop:637 length:480 start_codon:yes stop_codon:yes gene_type:complete
MQKSGLEFKGLKAMQSRLDKLGGSVRRSFERKLISKAATIQMRHIRKETPKGKTGNLKKSIKRKPTSKWASASRLRAAGVIGVAIGHERPQGAHSHLVAEGHRAFYWSRNDSGEVVKGNEYFQKGLEKGNDQVNASIKREARTILNKVVAKAKSKKSKK